VIWREDSTLMNVRRGGTVVDNIHECCGLVFVSCSYKYEIPKLMIVYLQKHNITYNITYSFIHTALVRTQGCVQDA